MRLRSLAPAGGDSPAACRLPAAPAPPAAAAPAWELDITPFPADFAAGDKGEFSGRRPTSAAPRADGQITIADDPARRPRSRRLQSRTLTGAPSLPPVRSSPRQSPAPTHGPVRPGHTRWRVKIAVDVGALDPSPRQTSEHRRRRRLEVASAARPRSATQPAPFGFLASGRLDAPLSEADGYARHSGWIPPLRAERQPRLPHRHPANEFLFAAGHPRDAAAELPRG